MKKIISLMLCTLILMSMGQSVLATNVGDHIGYAFYSDVVVQINGHDIESYSVNNKIAVPAEDLRNYGFNVEWNEAQKALYITRANTMSVTSTYSAPYVAPSMVGQVSHNVLATNIITYIGGNRVESNNVGGKTFIYLLDLSGFGSISTEANGKRVNLMLNQPASSGGEAKRKIGDIIGYAVHTDIVAQINGHDIASFNINGLTAVVAEDLRNYGFNVQWNEQKRSLYISRVKNSDIISTYVAPHVPSHMVGQIAHNVVHTDIGAYVNGNRVASYNIGGKTAVYIEDLAPFGNVSYNEAARKITLSLSKVDSSQVLFALDMINNVENAEPIYFKRDESSNKPRQKISVVCTSITRGNAARRLVQSESERNPYPNKSQEWCFMEFDVKYISAGGSQVKLNPDDLINYTTFYTVTGTPIAVQGQAILLGASAEHTINQSDFAPGETRKINIGMLIDKNIGELYLGIPDITTKDTTWIKCHSGYTGGTIVDDTPETHKGSMQNPYSATDGDNIVYHETAKSKPKTVAIKCTKMERGATAESIVLSAGPLNEEVEEKGYEWCYMEFELKYISAEGGSNEALNCSDIINDDTFFINGNPLNIERTAVFSGRYVENSIFQQPLKPGETTKVAIGFVVSKKDKNIHLSVPNITLGPSWIKCN